MTRKEERVRRRIRAIEKEKKKEIESERWFYRK